MANLPRRRAAALAIAAIILLLAFCASWAQEPETDTDTENETGGGEDELISLDFTDVDLKEVVKTISEMTGENFLIDKNVGGKITIISPTKVTKKEAYEIFLSVLEVNNLTVVKQGMITKIVPKGEVINKPIPTYTEDRWISPTSDSYITQLLPLANINVNDVAQNFQQLTSKEGKMLPYTPSNTLILVDTQANINRIKKILQKLDVEGIEEQIDVIALEYASAALMAEEILAIFAEEQQQTRRTTRTSRTRRTAGKSLRITGSDSEDAELITRIIPDIRTNSLIIKANKLGLKKIKDLVAKLDVPLPGGEGKIHVHYLQNADAEELATTLQALTQGTTAGRSSSQRQAQQSAAQRAIAGLAGGAGAVGGVSGAAGQVVAEFEGGVRVTADKTTNSLVIVASNRDYEILKEVIEKLDIHRRQVYVEAVIVEISIDKNRELGFEFRNTTDPESENLQILGGTNFGGIQNAAQNPLGITGLAIGAADGTITFGGQTFPNIGALFRALQSDSDVNVLSTPALLTMDNEEAEIVVADNIPFVTGQIYQQATGGPSTTIERKDVGITLKMTPQINESDYVNLQIYQEVSNVAASPEGLAAANVGVTTAKRSATTVVVVKDKQTVVIGGLIKDNLAVIETKVPLLGDIPILGYLFKSHKTTNNKTNLVIFLTPYVVRDARDMETVTRMRYEHLQQFKEENKVIRRKNEDRFPNPEMFTAPLEEEEDPNLNPTIEAPPREGEKPVGGEYPTLGEAARPDEEWEEPEVVDEDEGDEEVYEDDGDEEVYEEDGDEEVYEDDGDEEVYEEDGGEEVLVEEPE